MEKEFRNKEKNQAKRTQNRCSKQFSSGAVQLNPWESLQDSRFRCEKSTREIQKHGEQSDLQDQWEKRKRDREVSNEFVRRVTTEGRPCWERRPEVLESSHGTRISLSKKNYRKLCSPDNIRERRRKRECSLALIFRETSGPSGVAADPLTFDPEATSFDPSRRII